MCIYTHTYVHVHSGYTQPLLCSLTENLELFEGYNVTEILLSYVDRLTTHAEKKGYVGVDVSFSLLTGPVK